MLYIQPTGDSVVEETSESTLHRWRFYEARVLFSRARCALVYGHASPGGHGKGCRSLEGGYRVKGGKSHCGRHRTLRQGALGRGKKAFYGSRTGGSAVR